MQVYTIHFYWPDVFRTLETLQLVGTLTTAKHIWRTLERDGAVMVSELPMY
jgi:hypothetical protein